MRISGLALTVMPILAVTALSACTNATQITDPNGAEAWLVECGAAVSFSVCHTRARQICPRGYATISEDAGFNRKEVRIRCTREKPNESVGATAPPVVGERLRALQSLYDQKLITQKEYEERRRVILGSL